MTETSGAPKPDAPPTLQAPLIHLNGSSRERLVEQLTAVHEAANMLLEALSQAAPHGRDYYPLDDDAFRRAQAEHRARVQRATDILNEAADIRLQIVMADERRRAGQ